MAWVLDLDGVVWLLDEAIPGAAEAVARLRAAGRRVVFLTNNSSVTVGEYLAKLDRMGVPAEPVDVASSAQAAARLLDPGDRALVVAGPGVDEALRAAGVEPVAVPGGEVPPPALDAVVVGWHRDFDYRRLTVAMRAVRAGARLIGTNDDATYPTPAGVLPGGGSILAAVAAASGRRPEVAGKPYEPMAALLRERVSEPLELLVGDRPDTDGRMAERLGCPFGLVLSGVTGTDDLPVDPEPALVAADLAGLVRRTVGA